MDNWALTQPLPKSQQWAETQLDIIEQEIRDYQAHLDPEHDVALLLTNLGQSVEMEVESITAETPVLLVFRGKVKGQPAVLMQHVSQLSFLIEAVPKPVNQPHRGIGFLAKWEA